MRGFRAICAAGFLFLPGIWPACAQHPTYSPPEPAAPYSPPIVYSSPRAFPHAEARTQVYVPPPSVEVSRGRRGWDKDVIVEPEISLGQSEDDEDADPTQQVMRELGTCLANGVTLLVPCLRQNHSSVTIRRLEACLRSDSIPEDGNEVRACLAYTPY